jgi:enediyne biosynthesis protein E5
MPMTSAAFILFTLYMIPDPATTPLKPARQALFGLSVALVYGVIQVLHLVFGLFFALLSVCAIRGLSLHVYYHFIEPRRARPVPAPARTPAAVSAVQPA